MVLPLAGNNGTPKNNVLTTSGIIIYYSLSGCRQYGFHIYPYCSPAQKQREDTKERGSHKRANPPLYRRMAGAPDIAYKKVL